MSLSGKSAVVTGAALGIGKAMTEILLKNGAKVALLDVNKTSGETLKKALNKEHGAEKTVFLDCDVESEGQFRAAFQKAIDTLGGIDIMCNNAGILNEAAWEKAVSINVNGVIRGAYLALEHMNKQNGGRGGVIINIASIAGLRPFPCYPVYAATKHAVVAFTRSMATASVASGYSIRFNAICPGFVRTELFSNIPSNLGQFSHLRDAVQQQIDQIGIITMSQVTDCLLELVTDEKRNGEALMVYEKEKAYVTFPSFIQ